MEQLSAFFKAIQSDPRIGLSHISVYCALLQMPVDGVDMPVMFRSQEIMNAAKISGLATYHRCIKDLHEFGYLKYIPSYNHRKKSRVYL